MFDPLRADYNKADKKDGDVKQKRCETFSAVTAGQGNIQHHNRDNNGHDAVAKGFNSIFFNSHSVSNLHRLPLPHDLCHSLEVCRQRETLRALCDGAVHGKKLQMPSAFLQRLLCS